MTSFLLALQDDGTGLGREGARRRERELRHTLSVTGQNLNWW